MKKIIQNKTKLVNSVFSDVYKKYDLMNDILSFGIHRVWKERLLDWMNPQNQKKLIDVASGTGDIAKLFLKKTNNQSHVTCIEPNIHMLNQGKVNCKQLKNINWINAKAEELPIKNNTYDYYTISFGIRNVTDINTTLREAFRVLKPGGRFLCLEFSKINNEFLGYIYRQYSKTIPLVGRYIVGSDKPYEYLIQSIEKFHDQKQLSKLMLQNGFSKVFYRNLSNGISAIHSGWKI